VLNRQKHVKYETKSGGTINCLNGVTSIVNMPLLLKTKPLMEAAVAELSKPSGVRNCQNMSSKMLPVPGRKI